jgi:cysteine synthase A
MMTIGNTPLVPLECLREEGSADIFVKWEGANPTAEVYKQQVPGVRCIATEPEKSRALSGQGPFGGHRLEGMGAGFVPSIFRRDLADEIVAVSDEDAFATARRLAREEGIFRGITSGANVWVAMQRAKRLGPGHPVVTVIYDSGLKYLQGALFR